jgi:hypothetical protein
LEGSRLQKYFGDLAENLRLKAMALGHADCGGRSQRPCAAIDCHAFVGNQWEECAQLRREGGSFAKNIPAGSEVLRNPWRPTDLVIPATAIV